MRAGGTSDPVGRVRAALLGLFFILAGPGCGRSSDPHALARTYDREERTGLYTWLVDHEPAVIVAWDLPVARLRAIVPGARILAARANPCSEASREHAALVTVVLPQDAAHRRDRALDCGIALYRDAVGLVIAPR